MVRLLDLTVQHNKDSILDSHLLFTVQCSTGACVTPMNTKLPSCLLRSCSPTNNKHLSALAELNKQTESVN